MSRQQPTREESSCDRITHLNRQREENSSNYLGLELQFTRLTLNSCSILQVMKLHLYWDVNIETIFYDSFKKYPCFLPSMQCSSLQSFCNVNKFEMKHQKNDLFSIIRNLIQSNQKIQNRV